MQGNIDIHVSQVRLVQKVDTGKVYAMKSLQKAEMLKRDQVGDGPPSRNPLTPRFSLRMFALNGMFLQSLLLPGWFSSSIHFRTLYTFT